jgi:hypothetical protein
VAVVVELFIVVQIILVVAEEVQEDGLAVFSVPLS